MVFLQNSKKSEISISLIIDLSCMSPFDFGQRKFEEYNWKIGGRKDERKEGGRKEGRNEGS